MNTTFLEAILNNLMTLMPFIIVKGYQMGIRWSHFGRDPVALGPGIHWKLYFYHQAEVVNVVDEAVELPPQTVRTRDGHPVTFTANIAYRITDIIAHYTVEDFTVSTKALAMTHLAKRIRNKTLEELNDLDELETSLKGTLTTRFKKWGTEVFDVGFTNFAETKEASRLFLDIPTEFGLLNHREH